MSKTNKEIALAFYTQALLQGDVDLEPADA